jgi:hypothetical protein
MDLFEIILEQFTQNNEYDDADLVELDSNLHYTDYHKIKELNILKRRERLL